ncbi:hypothetical protein ABZS94_43265, partial [Streptomyces sp. NPDC005500]
MSHTEMTRRRALATAAGVTGAVSLASTGLLATPAVAAPQPLRNDELKAALRRAQARNRRLLTDRLSANRWEMQNAADDGGDIVTRRVPGTGLDVGRVQTDVDARDGGGRVRQVDDADRAGGGGGG